MYKCKFEVAKGESINSEFKYLQDWTIHEKRIILREISAFANTAGGDIYLPVKDNGEFGQLTKELLNGFKSNSFQDTLKDYLGKDVVVSDCIDEEKGIIKIHVAESELKIVKFLKSLYDPVKDSEIKEGTSYLRTSSLSIPMTSDELRARRKIIKNNKMNLNLNTIIRDDRKKYTVNVLIEFLNDVLLSNKKIDKTPNAFRAILWSLSNGFSEIEDEIKDLVVLLDNIWENNQVVNDINHSRSFTDLLISFEKYWDDIDKAFKHNKIEIKMDDIFKIIYDYELGDKDYNLTPHVLGNILDSNDDFVKDFNKISTLRGKRKALDTSHKKIESFLPKEKKDVYDIYDIKSFFGHSLEARRDDFYYLKNLLMEYFYRYYDKPFNQIISDYFKLSMKIEKEYNGNNQLLRDLFFIIIKTRKILGSPLFIGKAFDLENGSEINAHKINIRNDFIKFYLTPVQDLISDVKQKDIKSFIELSEKTLFFAIDSLLFKKSI